MRAADEHKPSLYEAARSRCSETAMVTIVKPMQTSLLPTKETAMKMPAPRAVAVSFASIASIASIGACALTALIAGPAAAQPAGTLEKVKASGVITVAYRDSSIPFSYLGGEGQPTGFGWEICGKVVVQVKKATGRADLKVATQSVTSQNRIPLLDNGTIDIECGSTTNNSDRAKQVQFAINYFYTGTRFLVKANSPIKGFADLKGKKVVS